MPQTMTARPKRAALFRRGFRLGYAAALRQARKELRTMAQNWDAKVASVQEQADKQLRVLATNFDAEVAAMRNDFADVVRDVHRYRAIEKALDVECEFDTVLH